MKKNNIVVLDNNGQTFDQYTIINRKTGDVWGCSNHPQHPQGFGQYSHNIADSYWNVAYGYSWREHINVIPAIKDSVANYHKDTTNIGNKVKLNTLPKNVIAYIDYILSEDTETTNKFILKINK